MTTHNWIVLAIGMIVSFSVALAVVEWFLQWARRHGFVVFAVYRIVLATILLMFGSRFLKVHGPVGELPREPLLDLRYGVSGKQLRAHPLLREQGNGLPVEREKCFRPKPAALIRDQAVGKIAAGFQDGESRIDGRPVDRNIRDTEQYFDRTSDLLLREPVNPTEYPHKFAKTGQRHSNQFSLFQKLHRRLCLLLVIADGSPN